MGLGHVTTAIPVGNIPGQASPLGGGDESQSIADSAVKFEEALAQTPVAGARVSGTEMHSSAVLPGGGFGVTPQALSAADDAWVEFLAVSEQLQNPQLLAEEKSQLLKGLAESWRSFQSQSEPIVRQLEDYIAQGTPQNR
jgi:hypothetical protein